MLRGSLKKLVITLVALGALLIMLKIFGESIDNAYIKYNNWGS